MAIDYLWPKYGGEKSTIDKFVRDFVNRLGWPTKEKYEQERAIRSSKS
jgi:hypothetical protein